MSNWPTDVLIIGEPGSGDTELLHRGLQGVLAGCRVQVSTADSLNLRALQSAEPTILFFVLDNTRSSIRPGDRHVSKIAPSKDIEFVWDFVEAGHAVHIALPPHKMYDSRERHTAIDTMALCLSSVAGIWEVNASLLDQRPDKNPDVRFLQWAWQAKRSILYGKVAKQLYDFQNKILGDWPSLVTDVEGDQMQLEESHTARCFGLATGIAGLEPDDLRFERGEDYRSLDNIADRLIELQDITGCIMGKTMYRKYLGLLERGWSERAPHYDKKRRNEMPLWAREDGFPKDLPLIKGCSPLDTAERLYQGFNELGFGRGWDSSSESQFATVNL